MDADCHRTTQVMEKQPPQARRENIGNSKGKEGNTTR